MTRAPRQIGDKVVIVAVDGTTSPKTYELIPAQNNYHYELATEEPGVQSNQPLSWPLSFHAGAGYGKYHPAKSPGFVLGGAFGTNEPNVIRMPPATTEITLDNDGAPVQYSFEATVNDSGADDGQPVLYLIAPEAAEINVYKISMDSGDFGTLLNTKTFATTPTQPCCRPVEWNNGSATEWYLGLGDNGKINKLTSIVSGTSADTWSTGTNTADARHLKVVGNELVRSTDENNVSTLPEGGDPTNESEWSGNFGVGGASSNITELGEASGLGYIAKEDGFYEWDLVGEATNIFPEIGKATRNGQGMVYWHGGFLIPSDSGLWWTRTGKPVGPDSNPNNRGNHGTATGDDLLRHGRWMGLAPFGPYIYGMYADGSLTSMVLLQGHERDVDDPPTWGPIIWQTVAFDKSSVTDFHGIIITETSEFSSTETHPVIWYGGGNTGGAQIEWTFLAKDGATPSKRGEVDLQTAAQATQGLVSGDFDFGFPRTLKQLRKIDGWAEDFTTTDYVVSFNVHRDGGSTQQVGSVNSDGFFELFFTQDDKDTAYSIQVILSWAPLSTLTDTGGPHVRDVMVHAVALPDTAQVWTFNFLAEDQSSKTAKKIRSELEGYLQDLKQYELPDGDKINGVMTGLRLLRADEIRDLKPDMQPPPKYVLQAQVRQMVSS